MTNEQLKAFIGVVDSGSFRGAAIALHKTQPSISNAVKALENQFNFLLLDRDNYRPELTREGQSFYHKAKQLLKQAGELEMLGHQLASKDVPTLAISVSAMCALPEVFNKIKNFCQMYPQIRMQISTQHLSGVLEQLQLEKSDLAIGPLLGIDQHYDFIQIEQVQMVTVASPKLIKMPENTVLSHQQLRGIPHILILDSGTVSTFDHVNVIAGSRPWYVNDYQMKKELLLNAMGWARIPEHIVKRQLEEGALIKLKVENFNSQTTVPMYLIKLKQQPLSTLAAVFWQQMEDLKGN